MGESTIIQKRCAPLTACERGAGNEHPRAEVCVLMSHRGVAVPLYHIDGMRVPAALWGCGCSHY